MKKRILSILLSLCMLCSLFPVTAGASETHTNHCVCGGSVTAGGHSHDSSAPTWTAWDGTSDISYADNVAYVYLSGDVNRTSQLTVSSGKTLNLCLNGNSITLTGSNSNFGAIVVSSDSTLNLCDCGSDGTVSYANGSGIVNNGGTVQIYGGTVSGNGHSGVRNNNNATTYIYGGTVSGGYGVFQKSDSCKLYVYGGTVSGTPNDIHNNSVYAKTYLSGTPTVDTIYTEGSYSSNIYASDSSSGGTPYSGSMITLKYSASSLYAGGDAVQYVTDTNQALFQLDNQNYTLEYSDGKLKIKAPTYSVTLMPNGGTISSGNVTSYTYGTAKSLPDSTRVSKSGYNFGGWYEDENFAGNAVISIAAGTTGDKIYYAKWIEKGHDHPVCGAAYTCDENHDNLTGWKKLTFADDKLLADGNAVEEFCEYANYYKLTAGSYYIDQETITLSKGLYIPAGTEVTLCLNGKTLNTGGNRNQIYGTLNITDCQTTAGKITGVSSGTESLLNINDSAALNLYQGELSGNETSEKGGAVYISNGGTFSMYGGTIKNNSANGGGGAVFVQSNQSVFNLYGGEISGNKTAGSNGGGAVYMSNGTFNMSGGVISGNSAEYLSDVVGGGVQMNSGTFNVSGAAQIKNNTRNVEGGGTASSNVLLWNSTISVVGALTTENAIGITTKSAPTEDSPIAITGTNSADYSGYFFADNSTDYEVVNDGGVLKLQVKSTPAPAQNYQYTNESGSTAYAETLLTAMQNAKSGTTIKVLTNCADDSEIYLGSDGQTSGALGNKALTLDLNGKLVSGEGGIQLLSSGAKLTFTDSSSGGSYSGTIISAGGELTVSTAKIDGYIQIVSGSLTVNSGEIKTLMVYTGANIILNGGTFSDTTNAIIVYDVVGESTADGAKQGLKDLPGSGMKYSKADLDIVTDEDSGVYYAYLAGPVSVIPEQTITTEGVVDNTTAGSFNGTTATGLDTIVNALKLDPANSGKDIEIKLTVTENTEQTAPPTDVTAIKTVSGDKTLQYLDLKLTQKIGDGEATDIGDSNTQLLTITIPFEKGNKQNITVFRCHETQAEELTENPPANAEGFVVGSDSITIYASKFSTYAIGYTNSGSVPPTQQPSTGGGSVSTYAITVEDTENGIIQVDRAKASAGTSVTLSAVPAEGYVLDTLAVTDSKGNALTVTDKGDGTCFFKMPRSNVTVTAAFSPYETEPCPKDETCPMAAFSDLTLTAWYHDGVHYCLEHDIMNGMGEDLFAPAGTTTRAQLVTMLWRLAGEPAPTGETPFTDVADGKWYTAAVLWASENALVNGYGNGAFGPNDPITREQLVAILYRYQQSLGGGFTGVWAFPLDFSDAADVSGYAYEAMCWCVMHGIITGVTDDTLVPQGDATRAQIAAIFQRYCENASNK